MRDTPRIVNPARLMRDIKEEHFLIIEELIARTRQHQEAFEKASRAAERHEAEAERIKSLIPKMIRLNGKGKVVA